MRRPLGLTFIIFFYSFIGGLTLALTFLQLLALNSYGLRLYIMDVVIDFTVENTILTRDYLASFPQVILLLVTISFTSMSSLFHFLLAQFLYLGSKWAVLFGFLFHTCSASSSFILWMFGLNHLKLVGFVFLSMNIIKAVYLYRKRGSA
jgi:hypothetical protein